MTLSDFVPQGTAPVSTEGGVRIIKPLQFDDHTPQTSGMHRLAAISHELVGSENLWAGVTMAEPNSASTVHHHGPLETVVYVAEGRGKLRWGHRLDNETDLEVGDFLFIPPFLPHQEINPSPDRPALWIVVRSAPDAILVELTRGADGAFTPQNRDKDRPSAPGDSGVRQKSVSPFWQAMACVVVFVVAAFGGFGLGSAGYGWESFLVPVVLALLALLAILWQGQARSARRLALLDAYAEREIARARRAPRRGNVPAEFEESGTWNPLP
jgi:uncharacterized RmlC-like cupin family protein